MQEERKRAFMESTGKSRPSSEGSSERPDFDRGVGSSSKPSHKGKMKKGRRRNKRRHEDSPDLEVPLTINECQGMLTSLQKSGAEKKRPSVKV